MPPKFAYTVATPDTRSRALAWSGDPESIFRLLSSIGYAGVELFVRDPATLDPHHYSTLAARYGLSIAAIGTGLVSAEDNLFFTDPDEKRRQAAIARAKSVVDFSAALGSQVNIGKFRGLLGADPQAMPRMEAAFAELCAHAHTQGVFVTLEPQNRFGIDNLTTTQEALAWVRKQNLPALRLMLDVFHMQIDDACIPASLVEAADMTIHIHFADTDRGSPGTGSIDFAMVLRMLGVLGYDRFISLEIKQTPDSESAARQAFGYLNALCGAIRAR